jgi:hypothetical protein
MRGRRVAKNPTTASKRNASGLGVPARAHRCSDWPPLNVANDVRVMHWYRSDDESWISSQWCQWLHASHIFLPFAGVTPKATDESAITVAFKAAN